MQYYLQKFVDKNEIICFDVTFQIFSRLNDEEAETCVLTPLGLAEFCVDVITIINTVPFGT